MIRGVSDLADEEKDSEEVKKWRLYACDVAAAYTVALLRSGPVPLQDNSEEIQPAKTRTGVADTYNHLGEEICIDRRWECTTFEQMRSRSHTIPQNILAFQVPTGKGKSVLLKRFYYICKSEAAEGKLILYAKVDFRDRSLTADLLVSEILGTFIANSKGAIQKLSSSTKFSAAQVTRLRDDYEKIISRLSELYKGIEKLTREQAQTIMSPLQQQQLAMLFSDFCRSISGQWTVVLLFDTWEDAGIAGKWFLEQCVHQLVELDNIVVVLAGRDGLSSLESRPDEVIYRSNFEPLQDTDDCQRWAELRYGLKINKATAEQFIQQCNGDLQKIDRMLSMLRNFPGSFPLINQEQ